MDACRNMANKEKGKERRQGKQKEEGDCLTHSPPFTRVGAALLIRTDSTHKAREVCGDAK